MEKITDKFNELKKMYDLKQIPEDVIAEFLKQYYAKLLGSVTYVSGSPYVIDNNQVEIERLEAIEEPTEAETKALTEIKVNLEAVEKEIENHQKNISYYLTMIESIKLLNK